MSGKEIMCNKKIRVMTVLRMWLVMSVVTGMLCGCTRREQLMLEPRGAESAAPEKEQAVLCEEAGQGQTAAEQSDASEDRQMGQSVQVRPEETEKKTICVHVCGAVNKAGVYELPPDSRVYEAVEKAGGFAENADESYVNQAQQLADGAKLMIPTLEQTQQAAEGLSVDTGGIGIIEQAAAEQTGGNGKININTATEAQLCEIPGIGATRAAAIAAYRQENGSFASIEEIMKVSGIKEGTYAKIKDSITVD